MAIVVEDGTGLSAANSYLSETDLGTYTDDRAVTLASGDAEAALIRATAALDAIYRSRFPGYRTHGRSQGLEWPRTAAYDTDWYPIANNEIPVEIKNALCEMAVRELIEPGSMMPDLERGGQIQALQAGSVRIDYGASASAKTVFQLIDGIMANILGPSPAPFGGYATRG